MEITYIFFCLSNQVTRKYLSAEGNISFTDNTSGNNKSKFIVIKNLYH